MQQQHNLSSEAAPPQIKTGWLTVLVGGLLCTLVVVLWWTLDQRERSNLQNKIKIEAEDLATHVNADLRNRIPSLQRMARRWEAREGIPKKEFISDARAYVSDVPGYQAVEWVDKDFIVRWIVPLEGNEKAQNLNLAFEEKRRVALEKAKDIRVPTVTSPIDLVQGGKGFLIYVPIYIRGNFDGFILAVFRIQEWLDYVFGIKNYNMSDDFRILVFFDDIPVFKQAGWDDPKVTGFDSVADTKILDHRLSIHIRPTQTYIEQNKTWLPKLTALFGVLLSGLVAFIVYLLQKAFVNAWATHEAKIALEIEINEHKKTGKELQDALSRLDMATKAGGIGVWIWDLSTDLLTWNERMYNLFDIPPDVTPTYATWRNAVHPDDLPATESLLKNAVQGKAVFNTEFRIMISTGSVRHIGAAARVERDHTGKPQRVIGINWDITDLKKAEETLKQSEAQVRLLLNSTAEAIYGLDLEGNCTFANPSCLRILGYTDTEQLLGKNMHRLIHHSHPDGTPMPVEECSIYRAFHEGKGVHRDDEVLWKADGTSFPAEYWSYPQIVNGKVSGSVVTFVDITQRKRAEESLAIERRRLSNILEGTNVGTWEWNVQTGETIFNERWAEIIGYKLEELSPVSIDTWMKFVHPDDLKVSGDLLEKHFKKELAYYECEARMRHKNGNWVWVLDRGKVATWTDDGKPLIMSGTHQEITQRKQAEEEIRKALEVKNAFTSTVSHELRTPLTVIMEGIKIVLDGSCGKLNPEQEDYLATAERNVDRLGRLINDVLDIQKLESGMMRFDMQENDLNELVGEFQKTMSFVIEKKGLDFELNIDEKIPKIVFDRDRMAQVLTNLLNNALKFTEKGKIVVVTEKGDNHIKVSVSDTGPGIRKEDMHKLFGKFEQIQTGNERKTGGTGLGLSICMEIISRHGGKIWAESEFGKGTTFSFILPITERRGSLA